MKQFLKKTFKIGLFIYLTLLGIQFVVDCGLKQSKNSLYETWNKIYNEEIDSDIVFFGSSRTLKHYNPSVFDKKMNVKSYNLGNNATAIDIQKIRNNIYFEKYKSTKIIVQNVDISSLFKTKEIVNKEQYFPYYTLQNFKALNNLDSSVCIEYLVPMYKYRGYLKMIDVSLKGYFSKQENNNNYKGFSVNNSSWDNKFDKLKKSLKGKKIDFSHINFEERFKIFDKMLINLNKHSEVVFLIWAPEYYERQELEGDVLIEVKNHYIEAAKNNPKIFFLDFTKDSLCLDKKYFYNSYHLNGKGASIFSSKVADSINKYYIN